MCLMRLNCTCIIVAKIFKISCHIRRQIVVMNIFRRGGDMIIMHVVCSIKWMFIPKITPNSKYTEISKYIQMTLL